VPEWTKSARGVEQMAHAYSDVVTRQIIGRMRSAGKEPFDDRFPRKAEVSANVGKDRGDRAHAD